MRENSGVEDRRVESGEWGSWGWELSSPPARESGERCKFPQAGSGVQPQPKSNLVHFGINV